MRHPISRMLAAATLAVLAGCGSQTAAAGGAAQAAPAAPAAGGAGGANTSAANVSIYSGVYTSAQATRGNQIQQRECSSCHSTADWSQGRILGAWRNQPALALIEQIRQTMPMDAPGRLSMQEYTDIFAFMLQLNQVPPGDAELPPNPDALRAITIEYRQ